MPRAVARRMRGAWWSIGPWLRLVRPPRTPPRLHGFLALIPVHEDAYTLPFCVRSVAPIVDQVLLGLDAPDPDTLAVVEELSREVPNLATTWSTDPGDRDAAGWATTRNRLVADARERFGHLPCVIMLDADDVVSWTEAAAVLGRLGREERVRHAMLGICELIGDWVTTAKGRTRVHDPNHVFWRATSVTVHFTTDPTTHHEQIHVVDPGSGADIRAKRAPQVLFHAVLAKPGDLLIRRAFVRAWLRAGRPAPLDEFIVRTAHERFAVPWPARVRPSEEIIFSDPYRTRLTPLRAWGRRLPGPVLAHQRTRPRFRLDLRARRRYDREAPSSLERRVTERLRELSASVDAGDA